jgi:hypothetical protein
MFNRNFFSYFKHAFFSGMGQFNSILTPEQEQDLIVCVQAMESRVFGLIITDLRKVSYQSEE